MIVEEFYDKELLIECIRFNAHFLDLCAYSKQVPDDFTDQINKLVDLLRIWDTREYPPNSEIDIAHELLDDLKNIKLKSELA